MPGSSLTTSTEELTGRAEKYLELIAPKLRQVELELERNFSSEITTIDDVGRHILGGGGKRIRPALLLLASEMTGYTGDRDVLYGAVVEMIHTATLVHDDVLDQASVRRGRTSINYRWGNNVTVLIGDYLYTHAMKVALRAGSLEILDLLCDATIAMTEGEIIALEKNGRSDLTVDEYFDIVGRKTAALFAVSCRIPAEITECPAEAIDALHSYGYNLGLCFQLVDDLLDFTSSTEVLGKPVLSDLKEGKVTLPAILVMQRATGRERDVISAVARDRSFGSFGPDEVLEIVNRYDGVVETRAIARDYADRARRSLDRFPESTAKEALLWAVDFVLQRDR